MNKLIILGKFHSLISFIFNGSSKPIQRIKIVKFRHRTWSWVPVIAPLVGGILGGLLYQLLIGFHTPQVMIIAICIRG